MANDILTYSPADVKIVLCGYEVTGVNSITLKWKSRPFTVHKGIRGRHTRVFNTDLQATIVLEILQTSITNDILTSILAQDRRLQSGRLELQVKDVGGTTAYQTTDCFLTAYPDVKHHNGLELRTWEIEVLSWADGGLGGNAKEGIDLFDSVEGAYNYLRGSASGLI
jgi:hypothetical protein